MNMYQLQRQKEKLQKQAEKEKKEDAYYREIAKSSIRCQSLGILCLVWI